MPAYIVVPQYLIDAIGPKLSSNENTGRVLAEQLARSDAGGSLLQKLSAGEELSATDKMQLPPLMRGHTWDEVANEIEERIARLQ